MLIQLQVKIIIINQVNWRNLWTALFNVAIPRIKGKLVESYESLKGAQSPQISFEIVVFKLISFQ